MRLHNKSLSKLSLINLLRRKRSDLKRFLAESGITTYETLKVRCSSLGVSPPSQQEFNDALGVSEIPNVSSPTEGVVIVESTSDVDSFTTISNTAAEVHDDTYVIASKQKRKKKDVIGSVQEKDLSTSEDD